MVSDIFHSDLAIADMTFNNPNAFYELGLRHAFQKPVIHYLDPEHKVPFDVHDQRQIRRDLRDVDELETAKKELAGFVAEIERDGYKVGNPVTKALGLRELEKSGDSKDKLVVDISNRLDHFEQSLSAAVEVLLDWRQRLADFA